MVEKRPTPQEAEAALAAAIRFGVSVGPASRCTLHEAELSGGGSAGFLQAPLGRTGGNTHTPTKPRALNRPQRKPCGIKYSDASQADEQTDAQTDARPN